MSGRSRAVAALVHPASLIALGLLIVNDQVLKGLAPGWFTGKLSDFAGLFFFPFLVGFIFERVRVSRPGPWAFGVVGAWFASMKLFAPVAAATESLVELIVPISSRIVVDPTDLIALLAFIPAWRIWTLAPTRDIRRSVRVAVLVIAAGASLATTDDSGYEALHIDGDDLYATSASDNYDTASPDATGSVWTRVAFSNEQLAEIRNLPAAGTSACTPGGLCVRILDSYGETLTVSYDHGATWDSLQMYSPVSSRTSTHVVGVHPRGESMLVLTEYTGSILVQPDGTLQLASIGRFDMPEVGFWTGSEIFGGSDAMFFRVWFLVSIGVLFAAAGLFVARRTDEKVMGWLISHVVLSAVLVALGLGAYAINLEPPYGAASVGLADYAAQFDVVFLRVVPIAIIAVLTARLIRGGSNPNPVFALAGVFVGLLVSLFVRAAG